jgi:hypothetical protein
MAAVLPAHPAMVTTHAMAMHFALSVSFLLRLVAGPIVPATSELTRKAETQLARVCGMPPQANRLTAAPTAALPNTGPT